MEHSHAVFHRAASPPRLPWLLALLLLALAVVAATPRPVGAAAPTPLVSSRITTPGQNTSSDCTLWRPVRDRRTGAIGYTIAAIHIFKPLDQLPSAFKTHAGGRVYDVVNPQGKPQPRNGSMDVPMIGVVEWNWRTKQRAG